MAAKTGIFDNPRNEYLNASDLALIRAAMAEENRFEQVFTCAIDKGGEHLECEVGYDCEFCPEGEKYEKYTAEDWARIRVLHPRFLLDMANIWVRMEDGLLNFDPEFMAHIYQGPAIISEKLYAFLNAVLLPAIESRVAAGKTQFGSARRRGITKRARRIPMNSTSTECDKQNDDLVTWN